MAIDEALLASVGAQDSPPTLRLYGWQPPALSLGFTQPATEADRAGLAAHGWDLVRRPTGGRAILHTDELTYSVVAPRDHALVAGGVMASYKRISQGLRAALESLGLHPEVREDERAGERERENPVCFEVPSAYELVVNGKKLIGSAQVRAHNGVLQHGTIPLAGDIGRICLALAFEEEGTRQRAQRRVRSRAATVSELAGRTVTWQEAADALIGGFNEAFGLRLEIGSLTPHERDQANKLDRKKHRDPSWVERL